MTAPRSSRRVFAAGFVGVLLVQTAWIIALPTFRGIDEFDHVYKAAAVARGQWTSSGEARHGRGGLVEIPGDIVAAASRTCDSYDYTGRDNCYPVERLDGGMVVVATAASAYNPTYYLLAGTLVRPFHGDTVDYVMRGFTAVMCALLLAWSATVVAGWGRTRWPLAALTLGFTPVLVYSTSIASPNGVAYSGAALLWVATLSLVRHETDTARLAAPVTVGAVTLATTHATGPMFAFLIIVLSASLRPVREWRAILKRDGRVWLAAAVVVLAVMLACVAWIGFAHPAALGEPTEPPLTIADYVRIQFLWALQAVAVFPTVTELAPTIVYALWGIPLVTLVIFTIRGVRGRRRVMVVSTLALLVLIPTTFTAVTYADEGLSWQGRYSLPLWLGVSTVAALGASRWQREGRPAFVPILFTMMATAAAISAVHVGRHEAEFGASNPAAAHIPGGIVLVGALAAAGVLLPVVVLARSSDLEPVPSQEHDSQVD